MEVQGYGNAARWVYAHAIDPGDWRTDALITMQEVRQVHSLAMSPVWQAAPRPDATGRGGSGMFREHDIQPFDAGMTPPSWPLVPARVQDWLDAANAAAAEIHSDGGVPLPEIFARLHDGFEKVHPSSTETAERAACC